MATITTADTRRDRYRRELALVLDLDVETLTDAALLADDLGLDSLARMSLLTWLETKGVAVSGVRVQPASVGDVLALLDKADVPGLSIRLIDGTAVKTGGLTDHPVVRTSTEPSLAPVLEGHDVRLTTIGPEDVRFLYTLATQPDTCFRWRYRGNPPPIDRFAADLWANVLVQFVARRTGDGEPVGHLVAYGADVAQGYAYLGAVFQPWYTGTGLAAQAVATFVRYLFHTHPLRKLYLEVPGYNWEQLRSGEGRLFQVEGIMRDHEHFAGRYWDRYLCAIYPGAGGLLSADRPSYAHSDAPGWR